MRNLHLLDAYRVRSRQVIKHYGGVGDETCGVFSVTSPIDNGELFVIASSGEGWDHVSVSRANRCPNWPEMEHVKRLFFRDDEVAMQLHVASKDHISHHPYCLHIWRPFDQVIPLPPKIFVHGSDEETKRYIETGALP
jgi:hypothetical protein